ncbi:MAG: IS3 family transposase [Gemmatimonadaceae bacterium]
MIDDAMMAFPALPLNRLCMLFGISRSGYYARQTGNARQAREIALRDAIERLVLTFPGYGYRRVTRQLQRDGWDVNHKRVLRVMREESLLCQLQKRFVVTTNSQHSLRTYPNLLAHLALDRLNQAWVADLTYIRLPTAFVYLAAILDAYSRRCIGWALSRWIDTRLTLAALEMALSCRCPAPGLIHHSDRGVQYAASEYINRLETAGVRISMSAVGNPYDNAKAESFFKTLKYEEVYLKEYRTFEEAESNLERFIEAVYNTKRLHSSLGFLPPVEFEGTETRNAEE